MLEMFKAFRLSFSILSNSLDPFVPCVTKLSALSIFSRWFYLYSIESKHLSQILLISAKKAGLAFRPPPS